MLMLSSGRRAARAGHRALRQLRLFTERPKQNMCYTLLCYYFENSYSYMKLKSYF